jgi:hypothetical protein
VKGELFEILRRRLYQQWVSSLVGRAATEIHEDALARLQAADERARFAGVTGAPGATPSEPGGPGGPGIVPGGTGTAPGGLP